MGLLVSAVLTRWLCSPGGRLQRLDHPGERSLHERPTPRVGGLAIVIGIAAGLGVVAPSVGTPTLTTLVGAAILVAGVSLADDLRSVGAGWRMLVHLLAAGLLLADPWGRGASLPEQLTGAPGWIAWPALLLALTWMTNLFNFMDGMDGFAAGMAVIGFATLAGLAGWSQAPALTLTCLVVSGAAAGFLIFNFPPARIFMGDVGSATLGFLAAGCLLWGARAQAFPAELGLLAFSPFVADATVTLIRRIFQGEPVWRAHRSHYYQRLVLAGLGHRRTVLWEYALMLSTSLTALLLRDAGQRLRMVALALWAGIYILLALLVDRRTAGHNGRTDR
jgi:UDP-N-acetylmuramyl pentapeptide phosphotransferase/UDP-N-acetylglucosamine-1-phosphate transferase